MASMGTRRTCLILLALLGSIGCASTAPNDREVPPGRTLRAEEGVADEHSSPDRPTLAQDRNPGGIFYQALGTERWSFDVLVGAEFEPDYAGSDDHELEPGLDARALLRDDGNNRYFLSLGEAGAIFDLGSGWAFAAVLEYEEARETDDNDALEDLDEVDDTIEAQLTLARRIGDFTFAAVAQPDLLGRGKGFVTFAGVGYDQLWFDDRLRFNANLDISFGDSEHMDTEFGISAAESRRSGLDEYNPGAGLKSASWELGLEYSLGADFSLLLGGELEYYFDRASDSPLIDDEGSEWTYGLSLGLRYRF